MSESLMRTMQRDSGAISHCQRPKMGITHGTRTNNHRADISKSYPRIAKVAGYYGRPGFSSFFPVIK